MRKHEILSKPTRPLKIDRSKNVAALLEKMRGVSFQGRYLGTAYQVWRRMLKDRVMIMMGMSGAMVPAGMLMVHPRGMAGPALIGGMSAGDMVGLTIEPDSGSLRPTSVPVVMIGPTGR